MIDQFILGDFLEYSGQIQDKSVDLTLTSPPDREETKFETNENYLEFIKKAFREISRVTKEEGFICISNTDRRENGRIFPKHIEFWKVLSEERWWIKEYKILIKKETIDLFRLTYSHVVIYTKKGTIGDKTNDFRNDLWRLEMPPDKNVWPFEFTERVIGNLSKEGDLVFDPFAGRGTALISAQKLHRHFLGFEVLPKYHVFGQANLEK